MSPMSSVSPGLSNAIATSRPAANRPPPPPPAAASSAPLDNDGDHDGGKSKAGGVNMMV